MNRTVYLIRHAESTGGRYDRHLFPKEGAPLSNQGIKDAKNLKDKLRELGVDFDQPVAVSELIRTGQTARYAGFKHLITNNKLNEVDTGLSPDELEEAIRLKIAPVEAVIAAEKLLKNPPKENIWVTHGMIIAGIGSVLQIPADELFIPKMASITKINLD